MSVEDRAGKLLAVGEFGDGTLNGRGACVLPFAVRDLPDASLYSLGTQSTLRAGRTYTRTELNDARWRVELEIGDAKAAALASRADCYSSRTVQVDSTLQGVHRDELEYMGLVNGKDPYQYTFKISGAVTNSNLEPVEVFLDWKALGHDDLIGWETVASSVDDEDAALTVEVDGLATKEFSVNGMTDFGFRGDPVGHVSRPKRLQVDVLWVQSPGALAVCTG